MTGSPPIGMFACDAGSLQELMADKTIACPCCNGPLTAEKLARLLADVQRLAAVGKDQPHSGSNGASRNQHAGIIIDPHAHMISRTTDDYAAMAKAGIVAVIEPAFWLGQPRTNVGSYADYFAMISGFERFRAGTDAPGRQGAKETDRTGEGVRPADHDSHPAPRQAGRDIAHHGGAERA